MRTTNGADSVIEPFRLVTLRHRMGTGKSSAKDDVANRIGLAISVLIHLILVGVILSSPAPKAPLPEVISVTIEAPQKIKQRQEPQIVSPSEAKKIEPPQDIPLRLSDNDSFTDKEQVQRGNNGGQPAPKSPEPPAPPAPPAKNEEKAPQQNDAKKAPNQAQPREDKPARKAASENTTHDTAKHQPGTKVVPLIKDLKLDDATLSERFGQSSAKEKAKEGSQQAATNTSNYAAFSRPPGSGAAFLGSAGTNDYLPNLPDGDITLLNAKANQYAGFVRRVAVQVFAQLRSQGWERLSAAEISRLADFTTIEAVLSPEGKFMRVRLLASSGSNAFDAVVNLSVSTGASDPNPPVGARASDGLIHFIFKARSWSQIGSSRRTGAPVEHRWLLLATGLE